MLHPKAMPFAVAGPVDLRPPPVAPPAPVRVDVGTWRTWAGHGLRIFAMWFGGAGRRTASRVAANTVDATTRRFENEILPHLDAAYDLARYLCRNADVAEDLVQEACLRAVRALETRTGPSPRAWLLAIVRNCHLDWRDRIRRTPSGSPRTGDDDDPFSALAAEGTPEDDLLRRSEAEAVRRLLHALPESVREILVLRDIEDCSYREIAEILDVPIGTVMSRLARARKVFAEHWTALADQGDGR